MLVGSSGVGKSTLVNALAGEDRMATAAIREDDAHGRHTTTHRELVLLPSGALILDTPGMRELGLMDAGEGLDTTFEDIEALAARLPLPRLQPQERARLRRAGGAGNGRPRAEARWKGFQKLQREASFMEAKEDRLARLANRKQWIAIAKANKASKKIKGDW